MNDPLLSALGLCRRAGKVICGTPMILQALQKGKVVCLVVEAADTSDATHKRITDKCRYYETPHLRIASDGEALAAALGKTGVLAAVGITEPSLAGMIRQKIEAALSAGASVPSQPQTSK